MSSSDQELTRPQWGHRQAETKRLRPPCCRISAKLGAMVCPQQTRMALGSMGVFFSMLYKHNLYWPPSAINLDDPDHR